MDWNLYPASDFPAHHGAWDELQAQSAGLPFLESRFLQPLLDVFGQGNELLAIGRVGPSWRAAALLRPAGRLRWELFMPSQLPLGPWIGESPQMHLDPVLRRLPGFVLALGAPQIDSRYYANKAISKRQRSTAYIETAWVDVDRPFSDFWEERGKNLRQNTRKQRNKLHNSGVATRLECVTQDSAIEEALQQYGTLEGSGWKAADGTHVHLHNDQGRFYLSMLASFARIGRTRIYRYWFDDKVVAMDLCICAGRKIIILKTAYDEEVRTVSPSTLMREEQFDQLFGEGLWDRIEFYGKVLEWHTRWTPQKRAIYHCTAYRWPWLSQLQRWRERHSEPKAPCEPTPERTTSVG